MTQPLPEDPAKKANWLGRYVAIQKLYDKQIIVALQQASVDAAEAAEKFQVKPNISSRVKVYQSSLVRKEIRKIMQDLYESFVPIIDKGQKDAAEAAVKAQFKQDAAVMKTLFPDNSDREKWEASMTQSARRGIHAMITRILETKQPLSKRVWTSGAIASGALDRKINSALARGASAKELAKVVKDDIRPGVAGGTSYAAMRLARTEINNAFHAQSIGDAQDTPWIEDMEWHLSLSHNEQGCLCEFYAREALFPKHDVPKKPHPQCMCYVTPKETDWQSFATQLQMGSYDSYYEQKYGNNAA